MGTAAGAAGTREVAGTREAASGRQALAVGSSGANDTVAERRCRAPAQHRRDRFGAYLGGYGADGCPHEVPRRLEGCHAGTAPDTAGEMSGGMLACILDVAVGFESRLPVEL